MSRRTKEEQLAWVNKKPRLFTPIAVEKTGVPWLKIFLYHWAQPTGEYPKGTWLILMEEPI